MSIPRLRIVIALCIVSFGMFPSALYGGDGISKTFIGLEGIEWRLVETFGTTVSPFANERQPYILLDPLQKKASGYAGCNSFFGGYELDGAILKFGLLASTRRACPERESAVEAEFFKALDKAHGWKIRDGVLFLVDGSDVLARFTMMQGN